jgi:hypothetical protein
MTVLAGGRMDKDDRKQNTLAPSTSPLLPLLLPLPPPSSFLGGVRNRPQEGGECVR